jgi:hypothetical protein
VVEGHAVEDRELGFPQARSLNFIRQNPIRARERVEHLPNMDGPSGASFEEDVMSLVKLLPAWFHAIADYAVGILLIVVAIAADGSAGATATGIVVGAVVLLVSALTKYPLTIHSAGDYLAAALLIVAPFALNFADAESGLAAFYVVMGVAVLAVSLITNYQYSPKRAGDGVGAARPVTA